MSFRSVGLSLIDLGETCTWGEALLLERAFIDDPRSAYGAARVGWEYPASVPEIAALLLSTGVLSFLSGEGKAVTFPMPWDKHEAPEPVPQEVVDEMKARLAKYSAFGDD